MIRTEHDLVAALEAAERDAPDATALLEQVRRRIVVRGRRRRTTAACLAVAIAVGAVLLVPALLPSPGSVDFSVANPSVEPTPATGPTAPTEPTPGPTARTRPLLTFTLRPGDAGEGMTIEPFVVTANRQWARVRQPGVAKGLNAELFVYEPGRLDVTPYLGGEAVSVNGRTGYYRVATDPDTADTSYPIGRPSLVWEYASGAWALAMSTQEATVQRDQLLGIARAVVLDTPVAAKVPFTVGYVPDHLRAIRLSQSLTDPTLSASVTFDVPGADVSTVDHEAGLTRPLQITGMLPVPRAWQQSGIIAGYPMSRLADTQVVIDVGGWWIEIRTADRSGPLPASELEQIMSGMTLATLTDPSTWFDATTAIPGGRD